MFRIMIRIFFLPIKANALIEVDITRGNLNPLPIAVSPLSIDENSKKNFEKILKKKILVLKLLLLLKIISKPQVFLIL